VSEVIFSPDYKLFPGINYFWVSLQMIPNASLLSTIDVELTSVKLDGQEARWRFATERATHRMGIGVRHAGDDGSGLVPYTGAGYL